jgi:hypothetical protein
MNRQKTALDDINVKPQKNADEHRFWNFDIQMILYSVYFVLSLLCFPLFLTYKMGIILINYAEETADNGRNVILIKLFLSLVEGTENKCEV